MTHSYGAKGLAHQSCLTNLSDVPLPTGEVLRVSNTLLARILAGTYPPGLRLPPEVTLAAELGCGRSTVREAIRHLSGLGLLLSRRGSGVLVLDFRREGTLALLPDYLAAGSFDQPLPAVLGELLRMRGLLASEAARLAATYATPASLVRPRELARRLEGLSQSPTEHTLCEVELFRELLHASAMWPAVWFANGFWAPLRAIHHHLATAAFWVPPGHAQMLDQMFAHIDAREPDEAAAVVRAHFDRVDREILPRIDAFISHALPGGPR